MSQAEDEQPRTTEENQEEAETAAAAPDHTEEPTEDNQQPTADTNATDEQEEKEGDEEDQGINQSGDAHAGASDQEEANTDQQEAGSNEQHADQENHEASDTEHPQEDNAQTTTVQDESAQQEEEGKRSEVEESEAEKEQEGDQPTEPSQQYSEAGNEDEQTEAEKAQTGEARDEDRETEEDKDETPGSIGQLKGQMNSTVKNQLSSRANELRGHESAEIVLDTNLTKIAEHHACHLAENGIIGPIDRYGRSIRQRYGVFLAAEGSQAYVSEISYGLRMSECLSNSNELPPASTILNALSKKTRGGIGKLVSTESLKKAYSIPGGDEIDFENLTLEDFRDHWLADSSVNFIGIGISIERPFGSEGAFKLSDCNIRIVEAFGRRQFDVQSIQLSASEQDEDQSGGQPIEDAEVSSLVGCIRSNRLTYNLRMRSGTVMTITSAVVKKHMSFKKSSYAINGLPLDKDHMLEPSDTEARGLVELGLAHMYDPYNSGTLMKDSGLVEVEDMVYPWQIIQHQDDEFSVPLHLPDVGLYYIDFVAAEAQEEIPRNEQDAPDKTAKELKNLYSKVNSKSRESPSQVCGSIAVWILPGLDWEGWNTYKARGGIVMFKGSRMQCPHYLGEGETDLFYGESRYGPVSTTEEEKEDTHLSYAVKDIYPASAALEQEFSGYRNQSVLVDRGWLESTALEEVPTTGPHIYGKNKHINLACSISGDGVPISDVDIIFDDETTAFEKVEEKGDSWELIHVNLAPLIIDSEVFKENFESDAASIAKERSCFLAVERSTHAPVFDVAFGIETSSNPIRKPEGYSWKKYEFNFGYSSCTLVLLLTRELEVIENCGRENHSFRTQLMKQGEGVQGEDVADFDSGSSMQETPRDDIGEQEAYSKKLRIISEMNELDERLETLNASNETLQKKLATYFAIRQSSDEEAIRSSGATGGDQDRGADETGSTAASEKERKYEEQLSSIAKQQVKMSEAQANFDSQSLELQGRLDVKDQQAREIADKLFHWKRSVARSAVNSKTGKGIPKNFIDTMLEKNEPEKDSEVETVRVRHIHLKNQLEKLEKQLKEKEQLADGLALIDFEQLKIENSTLNEKIEDRNEELHKLRKKTTSTVQVLTHVKEKLQFVASEAHRLKQELSSVEEEVTQERDKLAKGKHKRDEIRQEIDQKKSQQSFAHSDLLAKDFEYRLQKIDEYTSRLSSLKERHRSISHKVKSLTSKRNAVEKELEATVGS